MARRIILAVLALITALLATLAVPLGLLTAAQDRRDFTQETTATAITLANIAEERITDHVQSPALDRSVSELSRQGDWAAARNVIDTMAAEINKRDYPEERRNAMAEMMISGWGGFPLIGTKDQIVDGLATLSKIGLDGVLLSWPRYIEGMREFRDVTYPLLKQAGLRD